MSKHLAVICQPEVLGPAYLEEKRHVALNITVAIVDGDADATDRKRLRPWEWQKLPFIVLVAERSDGSFGAPETVKPLEAPEPLPIVLPPTLPGQPTPSPPPTPDEQKKNLRDGATAIVNRHNLAELTWTREPGEQQGNERHLPSLLMDMSRWPAPLPQQLNLVHYVPVDETYLTDAKYLHAAPIFIDKDGIEHKPKDPTSGALRRDGTQTDMYVWDYEDADVVGYGRPFDTTMKNRPKESYIDLDRLWIRARLDGATGGTWYAADWAGEVPEKIAEALDAASRLYEFGQRLAGDGPASQLRAALERRDTAPIWGRTWLRRAALRALRRYAHVGRSAGPDGQSFLAVQLNDYQEIVGSPIHADIVNAVADHDKMIDDELDKTTADSADPDGRRGFLTWRTLLREVVGGMLASSDVLLRSPLEPPAGATGAALPPLADDLAALNGLIAQVRDARVLFRLVMALWRRPMDAILPGRPDLAAPWREVEQNLERLILPRYNLRRRLALSSAGTRIGEVFERLGDVEGKELEALRDQFVTVHEDSVRADLNSDDWLDKLPDGSANSVGEGMKKLFREVVRGFAARVAERQLFPGTPDDEAGDVRPAERPHRIGLQIDRLMADTDRGKPQFGDSDYLRRLAGVAVFLRQAKPRHTANPGDADFGDWRSLNMAKLSILISIQDGKPIYKPVSGASIVAYGVPYRDGVRKAFIYYDNVLLIAPAEAMTAAGVHVSVTAPADDGGNVPLLSYERTLGSPWALEIPCLRFGQVYEALCAAMPNAGALPRGWNRDGAGLHPAILAADPSTLGDSDVAAHDQRRVRYLRRVRVGQLRIKDEQKSVRRLATDSSVRQSATDPFVRPLFNSFDTYARPAGLRASETAAYYRHAESARPQLALAGTQWRLAVTAIEAAMLSGGAEFTVALTDGMQTLLAVKLSGGGGVPYLLDLTVGSSTETRTVSIDAAERLDLVLEGKSAAADKDPFASVPTTLRGGLQVTGTHPRRVDPAPVIGATPPAVAVYVQVGAAGGGLNFDRPSVRVGPETIAPESASDLPRILLPPGDWPGAATSYRFEVRTPTTDVATWDRWRAMDEWLAKGTPEYETIKTERADVLSDHLEELRKPAPQLEKVALDDPGVSRRLMVELIPVFSPSQRPPVRRFVDFVQPPKHPDNPFAFWQAPAIAVVCTVMKPAGELLVEPPGVKGPELMIRVPEGEIWEARLSSLVETKFFYDGANDPAVDPGRFPVRVREGLPTVVDGSKSYVAVGPYRFVLEGATARMPAAVDLWQALVCRQEGGRVRVRLEPTAAAAGWDAFAYLGKVEIKRQLWRWEGRPSAFTVPPDKTTPKQIEVTFPYDRTPAEIDAWENGGEGTALLWDAIGFSDRDDDDFVRSHRFAELAPAGTMLYERDITSDRRAQYYRFAVVATSRYRGLIVDVATDALATARNGVQGLHPDAKDVDPDTPVENLRSPWPWRRLFVPCRRDDGELLPKPKLKFVVPLTTRTDEEGGQLPGLLVVLDEPWFDIGGLPEWLACEVSRVPARKKELAGADPDPFAYAYPGLPLSGPDPMLHTGHWLDYDAEPTPGRAIEEKYRLHFEVRGPIGYTFDRETSAPRFVGTSFFLEPSLYEKQRETWTLAADIRTLPWAFVSLQFRRVIRGEGRGLPDDLVSELTGPFWHQLLPDASRFAVKLAGDGDPPTVERSAEHIIATGDEATGKLHFLVTHGGGEVEGVPQPAPKGGKAEHRLFVLMTRRIYNMWGERKDKSYIGVAPVDGGVSVGGIAPPLTGFGGARPLASDPNLQLRLIEVQYHEKDAGNETLARALSGKDAELLWDALFPEPPDANPNPKGLGVDVIARILRVSAPLQWRPGSAAAS